MAARANLVINDRAATPVAHTFTPDGSDKNNVAYWSEKTSVPAGNPQVSWSLTKSNGKYKLVGKYTVPVVQTQTINGVSSPIVLRIGRAKVEFDFDALSLTQERADLVGFVYNSLPTSQTQINDMIVNVTPVW